MGGKERGGKRKGWEEGAWLGVAKLKAQRGRGREWEGGDGSGVPGLSGEETVLEAVGGSLGGHGHSATVIIEVGCGCTG